MTPQNTNSDLQFLSGGGEMGELMRQKNWSETSLGSTDTWPQSLRTTLSIILNSKFPMFLFWGSELICFYNDAYRPSLGIDGKHPYILGNRAEDYWKEIWDEIKPIIDAVLQKGESTWNEDMLLPIFRNGKMEDVYWTFSYSPVYDESGKPAGVFVTTYETTQKINNLNKLNQSNTTYLNNLQQAPLAMSFFKGKDFTVEIVNDQMLEIWGKKHHEVINQPIFEGLPEAKEQGLEQLLYNVFTTGEKFVANERTVILPKNGKLKTKYLNFVYEAFRDVDGSISGVIAAATDVTKQVLDRKKLEEAEQKVRALVENAPFAIAVYTGEEMRVELANETIINIWGKGNDVIGKTFSEILPELANQSVFEQIKEVYHTGKSFHTKNTPLDIVVNGVKDTFYFNYDFTPLYDLSGTIYGVMNTGIDLTDLNLAKEKLETSDKRFRNTVRQAPVPIAILRGIDFVVEMANDSFQELVQKTECEFVNKPLFESLPELEKTFKHLLDNVIKTGNPYKGNEIPVSLNKNNEISTYYFDILLNPLKEDNGEISGVIVTASEVTENVVTRKKIEQNEERLKMVIEASELGTWELNLKTDEINYSQRFLKIIGGYDKEIQLSHTDLVNHIHPDDLVIRENAFKKAFKFGNLKYEARLIWKDGSYHCMEGKGRVYYNENNEPEKLIGTVRDITQERKDKQLLIENEQKFRLLSDSMPQQIWTSDTEGNINYYNKSVFQYSGLSLDTITEKGWLDIVHPDDREENLKHWIHCISTGQEFLFEHRFRRYDGEYRWQLSRALPQKDENGKIQMWVGTSTDIHNQKMFTNELEKKVSERTNQLNLLYENLKQSEERYHLMVEEVQDYAILYLNNEGIVENWNKGAEKIKGYKAEEIVGKSFDIFYTAKDRENNLPQYLLSQAVSYGRYGQEGWRIRKDGTHFWASVVITAVHNDKNQIIGFSKVTHDLSAKKEADDRLKQNAEQLQQKNQELEKMNKELQSFAYISSHDLQEPLRKIQTFSNQIIDKELDNLSESGKDKFQRMRNAAQRMQTLINDLLAYSRTNTSERKLIKTDLNLIIEEVKEDLEEELIQKNAILEIERVHCDVEVIPFQIQQLMYNLISNSLKFTREGIPPVVKIKCEINLGKKMDYSQLNPQKEYCHITFTDNGIGFDAKYSDKIFEVFQRLHGKETYHGTGIGLAIVKKIVENHNGFITASGEVNKGAIFNVYIPLKE